MTTEMRLADRAEVLAAVAKAAFPAATYCHCGTQDGARMVIHSLSGAFGADWDLADVVDVVVDAPELFWQPSMGHDLLVITPEGRRLRFQVSAPAEEVAA